MTYGFLRLFAFVRTISYQNWFVNVDLYYLQLFTIMAYHLNVHIMLLRYVICNYIWHMVCQNYELNCTASYVTCKRHIDFTSFLFWVKKFLNLIANPFDSYTYIVLLICHMSLTSHITYGYLYYELICY